MKYEYKITLDIEKQLTESNVVELMHILKDRMEGYYCEMPSYLCGGEMSINYINESKSNTKE